MEETSYDQQNQHADTQYNAQTITINQGIPSPIAQAVVAVAKNHIHGRILGDAPFPNPLFTGRERELADLYGALHSVSVAGTSVPAAFHGMAGVGKTQTACQYAYRNRDEYAVVCWVSGETLAAFQAQLASLAPDLSPDIPISNDQQATCTQVKRWLEAHGEWLLVVDNAENLDALRSLLPEHRTGRVLLTTRETVPTDFATRIDIDYFDAETGATLLLRRAGFIDAAQSVRDADPASQADARAISEELGGLALALEAAGAYIQERNISAAKYREYYAKRRHKLHKVESLSNRDRVTVTFGLALERLAAIPNVGKAAAQLVQMCAFLAPNSIPDEIFLKGAEHLEPELARFAADEIDFQDVVAAACRYGLVRREGGALGLWMHRLAQEVVRDSMSEDEQKKIRKWVVLAVSESFPVPEYETWGLCERLLPHALLCETSIINDVLHTEEAARLLNETALYLRRRARYEVVERLYRQALAIRRQVHSDEHREVATSLNNLGLLLTYRGKYAEAEQVLRKAVEIDTRTIGTDHSEYANHLDNLAHVYYCQSRYEEALSLSEQALHITRRHLDAQHHEVAIRLNNLAAVYTDTRRFEEAVAALEESLSIYHTPLGAQHPAHATTLFNLAATYIKWGKLDPAEPLLQQAISLYEAIFGTQHPETASCYYWLGALRYYQKRLAEASVAFEQALAIREQFLGTNHPDTVNTRDNLAVIRERL